MDFNIGECDVAKVLIDIKSFINLIYKETLTKINIPKSAIKNNRNYHHI